MKGESNIASRFEKNTRKSGEETVVVGGKIIYFGQAEHQEA